MTASLLFDTSVYIAVLRDATFAAEFRWRYLRAIPRTHFSSVVVQELLAGARTPRHRKLALALYEPFEGAERIVTPTHAIWKEAGNLLATLAEKRPGYRSKLSRGLLTDVLIALSGRAIGATVVTRNADDFHLVREFSNFDLEVV